MLVCVIDVFISIQSSSLHSRHRRDVHHHRRRPSSWLPLLTFQQCVYPVDASGHSVADQALLLYKQQWFARVSIVN